MKGDDAATATRGFTVGYQGSRGRKSWAQDLELLLDQLVDRMAEGDRVGGVARRVGAHFGRVGEDFERVLGEVDTVLVERTGTPATEPVVRAVALGWADGFPLADDDIHREPLTGLVDPATLVRRLDAVRRRTPGLELKVVVLEVTDVVKPAGDPLSPVRGDLVLTGAVELLRPMVPTVLSWTRFGTLRAGAVVDPVCSADDAVLDARAILASVHRPWEAEVWHEPVPERARSVVDLVRLLAS